MSSSFVQTYVRMVQHDLSAEAFAGFQLAFLRPFAVPHMADVLSASGSMSRDAERRAYTTGLMMYEVIYGELESPRARRVISQINRAHAGLPISDEDFAFVLDSFIVVPTRYMDTMGWRRPTTIERDATWGFYCRLAELMNITYPPTSFDHAVARFDAYETRHVKPSTATRELGAQTLAVLQERLPMPLRKLAPQMFSTQLDDPPVAEALGLPRGRTVLTSTMRIATAAHGRRQSRKHATTPFFTPGRHAGRTYAQGYTLDQLLGN